MQLKIIKIFLFLAIFIVYIPNVWAEDVVCEYPEFDITLTYTNGSGKPKVDYSNWKENKNVTRFFNIYKYTESIDAYEEIDIDKDLYLVQGATCPTKMYICEYTDFSFNSMGVISSGANLLGDITDLVEGLINIFTTPPNGLSDFNKKLDEVGWSLTSSKFKLYLLGYQSYSDHEYRKWEGGVTSSDFIDNYLSGYNNCKNVPFLKSVAGFACGIWDDAKALFAGLVDGGVINEDWNFNAFYHRDFKCKKVTYKGEHATTDVNCSFLDYGIPMYTSYVEEYKTCSKSDKSCRGSKVKVINDYAEKLRTNCDRVLSTYTYNEIQKDCINYCLTLDKQLNEAKKGTDLYIDLSKDESNPCFISPDIVNWILKIVTWMRYIAPVLLILLSVLDFIKAIAADSDDEVKKVTSRFVKRLIVSVLIILLPLLLQFLLGIFGISASNFCL